MLDGQGVCVPLFSGESGVLSFGKQSLKDEDAYMQYYWAFGTEKQAEFSYLANKPVSLGICTCYKVECIGVASFRACKGTSIGTQKMSWHLLHAPCRKHIQILKNLSGMPCTVGEVHYACSV